MRFQTSIVGQADFIQYEQVLHFQTLRFSTEVSATRVHD